MSLGTSDPVKAQAEHDRLWALIQSAKVAHKMVARHAMIFPDAVIKEIERADPIPERVPREKKRLKLVDMVELARQYKDISKRSEQDFMRFIKDLPVKYADEVTPAMAVMFLEQKYGGGDGKTYNNYKSLLNSVFKCCLIQAGLSVSPFDNILNKRIRNQPHHRPLTTEEFKKAFSVAPEPWKTASLISWHTALRRETCFKLSWAHINEDDHSITIMPGKTARFGRAVYIPIHDELWQWLNNIPKPANKTTPILSQFPYKRLWTDNSKSYYAGLLQSLGIHDNKDGKASFHSLRVSFITRCDEHGILRNATRGIAGHTTDDMTDLYSHDHKSARQILTLPAAGIEP